MSATIQINIDTMIPQEALARLVGRMEDTHSLLDAVGAGMVSHIADRFELGRGPDGTPWLPSRRAELEGGQTLVDRGHLRDSYTHRVDGDHVAVGSNLIYAGTHQFGATIRAKNGKGLSFDLGGNVGRVVVQKVEIPARPVLGIGADDEELIEEEARVFVLDALGGDQP